MSKQDVIIVGGGIAGLSAAIYTAQAGLPTVVFDSGKSQLKPISKVYNYPGFPEGIEGETLVAKMREQAVKFGAVLTDEEVKGIERQEGNTGWKTKQAKS